MKKISLLFIAIFIIALALAACSSGEEATAEVEKVVVPTATAVANVPTQAEESEPEDPEAPAATEVPPEVEVDTTKGLFDIVAMQENLQDYVLRPEDMPNEYRITEGGELHQTNLRVIQNVGEVAGKRYIAATKRTDGWSMDLERVNREELIPYTVYSEIELFETTEGAQAAISADWLPALQETEDEEKFPNWIEDGCDYGDACLTYYYDKFDKATELTTLQYEIVFVYRNVVGRVMARGVDYDMDPDYFYAAAENFFNKIDAAPLAE